MINPFMEKKVLSDNIMHEYFYSISSVIFNFIEIYNIVFIADAIEKEVSSLYSLLLYRFLNYA